ALPVPTPEQNPQIRFYPAFNQNTSLQAYSRNDFDLDGTPGNCVSEASPFDDGNGAGNYYSASNYVFNNVSAPLFNGYIPNSDGFPFIRTEYTPDNTGRIRRQGGVGPDHQLGSD